MSEHVDAIVVGAGIAGLHAALTLHRAGRQVLVLESSDGIGGRVRTDEVDGFLLDRGFQILNPAYPELQRLGVLEELDLRPFDAGIMIALEQGIARIGDPRRRPQWFVSGITAEIGDLKSKARMIAALGRIWMSGSLEAPAARMGSVADALRIDGVDGGLYERALEPFLRGVFLDDPAEVAAGYGDFVLRSLVSGTPALPGRGMGALPRALALRLPSGSVRTGVRVTSVAARRVVTDSGEFTADDVVVAVDPVTAREWFPTMQVPETRACTTWYHVTDDAPTQDGAILVDGLRRGPVVNSCAISKVAPGYASRGSTLMSTTTLGVLASAEDERAVRDHLSAMWRVNTDGWQLLRAEVVAHALPSLGVGQPLSKSVEVEPGLYLAGDHRETPSQQGALASGRRAAEAVLRRKR